MYKRQTFYICIAFDLHFFTSEFRDFCILSFCIQYAFIVCIMMHSEILTFFCILNIIHSIAFFCIPASRSGLGHPPAGFSWMYLECIWMCFYNYAFVCNNLLSDEMHLNVLHSLAFCILYIIMHNCVLHSVQYSSKRNEYTICCIICIITFTRHLVFNTFQYIQMHSYCINVHSCRVMASRLTVA